MLTIPARRSASKIALKSLLLLTLVALVFSPSFIVQQPASSGPAPLALHAPAPKTEKTSISMPVRLSIPKISVDAPINLMGTTPDGAMEAPSGAHDVGWYKFGSQPGNEGTAVIAGHYGRWKNGDHSVFDNLNKLHKGDNVYVQDAKGVVAAFVVRETRMLDRKSDSQVVFAASDDKAHLNLITCQGKWDESQKTYSDRLVVFADKL